MTNDNGIAVVENSWPEFKAVPWTTGRKINDFITRFDDDKLVKAAKAREITRKREIEKPAISRDVA